MPNEITFHLMTWHDDGEHKRYLYLKETHIIICDCNVMTLI